MKAPVGELIAFEGPDGVGKSSFCRKTADFLSKSGISADIVSFPGRSKGTLGRLVYDLHHNPEHHGVYKCSPLAMQTLHVAAQIEALSQGQVSHEDQLHTAFLTRKDMEKGG